MIDELLLEGDAHEYWFVGGWGLHECGEEAVVEARASAEPGVVFVEGEPWDEDEVEGPWIEFGGWERFADVVLAYFGLWFLALDRDRLHGASLPIDARERGSSAFLPSGGEEGPDVGFWCWLVDGGCEEEDVLCVLPCFVLADVVTDGCGLCALLVLGELVEFVSDGGAEFALGVREEGLGIVDARRVCHSVWSIGERRRLGVENRGLGACALILLAHVRWPVSCGAGRARDTEQHREHWPDVYCWGCGAASGASVGV